MATFNCIIRILLLIVLLEFTTTAAEQPPKLNEVVDLLKSKLSIVKPEQIEEAALAGILNKYSNLVQLVSTESPLQPINPVKKAVILETNFAYFHIQNVGGDLVAQFKKSLSELEKSNTVKGLIIDLRFASGNDYSVCADFLDLFFEGEKQLFSIGKREFKSKQKEKPIKLPTAVLINKETACAAEVIGEILRQNKLAVLIGSRTSGNAYSFEEFKLSTGQTLKIAIGTIINTENIAISTNGIAPDISVEVSLDEEREFIDNPYKLPKRLMTDTSGSGKSSTRKLNEAELVRMKKEGIDIPTESTTREKTAKPQQEIQIIHDPSLARALDLLKVLTNFHFERLQ